MAKVKGGFGNQLKAISEKAKTNIHVKNWIENNIYKKLKLAAARGEERMRMSFAAYSFEEFIKIGGTKELLKEMLYKDGIDMMELRGMSDGDFDDFMNIEDVYLQFAW